MKSIIITLLGSLLCTLCAAADPLEFSGYLKMSGEPQFVLTETPSGKSSGWLRRGQSFQGYKISDFDPKSEVLSVSNTKEVLRLPLKQAKVEDREASLARILAEQEARFVAPDGDKEGVFLSRIALFSFRRDATPGLADKVRIQEQLVSTQEERESFWKSRRAMGVATEFDVLEKTEDLLRSKVKLGELKASRK